MPLRSLLHVRVVMSVGFPHKNDVRFVQLFVGGFMSYLRYLCAFGFLICLSSFCVLITQCFQFLWIVHFVNIPSVFSNIYCIATYVYIYSTTPHIMSRVCELFTHSFGRVFNITTQSFNELVTKDALLSNECYLDY